jgi:predicted nucleotide-binding protein (sugar kinase/HSP70/actin superfamily)
MSKYAVLAGLGAYYENYPTGCASLKFIYQNVADLAGKLDSLKYTVSPPLLDERATKENILTQLKDVINKTNEGDTVLFYYTGHGNNHFNTANNKLEQYLVTALTQNWEEPILDTDDFVNNTNYNVEVVKLINKNIHLITVLDCCYAFGLIEGYDSQKAFHSVIAAASEYTQAPYNSNSLFFTAFKMCWDETLDQIKKCIPTTVYRLKSPTLPKIQLAEKYSNQTL